VRVFESVDDATRDANIVCCPESANAATVIDTAVMVSRLMSMVSAHAETQRD
jgi:hypothetical protein